MSVHVTSYIWKHSKQSGTRMVMMLSIADRCDDDGGCFPGQRDLADRARLTNTKSASGIVNKLAADGELTIVRRQGHSNYYFARKYCIANGIILEDRLKEQGPDLAYVTTGVAMFDQIENDPRYVAILEKMGLPPTIPQ